MSSGRVQARIDPFLQEQAERIINQSGYSVSKLMTVIFSHIVKTKELPITIEKIPNALTLQSIRNIQQKIHLKKYTSGREALKSMNLL